MAYKDPEKQKAYARQHYQDNKAAYVERAIRHRRKMTDIARRFVYDYLSVHPCMDCGERDPVCLEFDHQRDKQHHVSRMVLQGYSVTTIMKEINKCQVVCSNCHRRRTARQFEWAILSF